VGAGWCVCVCVCMCVCVCVGGGGMFQPVKAWGGKRGFVEGSGDLALAASPACFIVVSCC
jgi:hypothetical protein